LDMDIIEITAPTHDVEIDLVYGSDRNFTTQPIYANCVCYLHRDAASKLDTAVELAAAIGLRLKIFDALRPSEAQWVLWNHTPDPDFLADPRRGSPHSRGAAIDLTLIDERGNALDMGTAFDAFTPLSHHGNTGIDAEAQRNRHTLLGVMTTAGWDFYRNEWWHYQLFGARDYPLVSDGELPTPMMPDAKPAPTA
jgi:zinc D-Ala-D-Ala dipeptidase